MSGDQTLSPVTGEPGWFRSRLRRSVMTGRLMSSRPTMEDDAGRPSRVRVGAVTYRIVTDPEAIKEASDASDAADRGGVWKAFSNHDRLLIGLPPGDADDANRVSLLHELLHCCLRHSGAWPDMYARVLDSARDRNAGIDVEEFMVAGLTAPLLGVLRDNPNALRWLTASHEQSADDASEARS